MRRSIVRSYRKTTKQTQFLTTVILSITYTPLRAPRSACLAQHARRFVWLGQRQNLRMKTFVGTSGNAVHTQVRTALIAMLLLRYLQLRAKFGWSLSNLAVPPRRQ